MSLGNFFKQLLAEKQAKSFSIVQDSSATHCKKSKQTFPERKSKQRPTLAKSSSFSDVVPPSLPKRQESQDGLHLQTNLTVGQRKAAPKVPLRIMSPTLAFARKRFVSNGCTSSDSDSDDEEACVPPPMPLRQVSREITKPLAPIVEQARDQNSIFSVESCPPPKMPKRQESRGEMSKLPLPFVGQKGCPNAFFSPKGLRLRAKNSRGSSAFSSFCEETRGILASLPSPRSH